MKAGEFHKSLCSGRLDIRPYILPFLKLFTFVQKKTHLYNDTYTGILSDKEILGGNKFYTCTINYLEAAGAS